MYVLFPVSHLFFIIVSAEIERGAQYQFHSPVIADVVFSLRNHLLLSDDDDVHYGRPDTFNHRHWHSYSSMLAILYLSCYKTDLHVGH